MTTQHIETLIIGAGQAGLSTGYHLQQLGRPFLIVDGNERIGDNWRHQWDTLKLYTPAKYDGLPGLPFPAPPWSLPRQGGGRRLPRELRAALRPAGADEHPRPAARAARRRRLHREPGARTPSPATTWSSRPAPSAARRTSRTSPATSTRRSCSCTRASTADPTSSRPDAVLVVGASHSGCDIAYEAAEHRPTILAGRDCGQIPIRWGSRALRYTFPVLAFAWRHVLTRRTPIGRKEMEEIRAPRRPDAAGQARRPPTARGRAGAGPGHRRQRRPARARRRPRRRREHRGLVHRLPPGLRLDRPADLRRGRLARGSTAASSTRRPGLFFCGLAFQYAFSSMVFLGVGRDAEYVARRIDARRVTPSRSRPLPEGGGPRAASVSSGGEVCAMGVVDDLARAREAYERREWVAAYDSLSDARRVRPRPPTTSPGWR